MFECPTSLFVSASSTLVIPREAGRQAGEARASESQRAGAGDDSLLTVRVCPLCFDCAVPAVQ